MAKRGKRRRNNRPRSRRPRSREGACGRKHPTEPRLVCHRDHGHRGDCEGTAVLWEWYGPSTHCWPHPNWLAGSQRLYNGKHVQWGAVGRTGTD